METTETMETKPSYPPEYLRARSNILTESQLEVQIKKSTPLFVFNYLMIPAVLQRVITEAYTVSSTSVEDKGTDDAPNSSAASLADNMTPATLSYYKLLKFGNSDIPALLRSYPLTKSAPVDKVKGLLVFGLNAQQRGLIHQFESDASMPLKNVRVMVPVQGGTTRTVDAGAFVWKGSVFALVSYGSEAWEIDTFLQSKMYEEIMGQERREEAEKAQSRIEADG